MATSVSSTMRTSIHGRRLGLGAKDQLVSNDKSITNNAVEAVITIPALQATAISIQLNNADGTPIAHIQEFELYVLKTDGTDVATTGGSTGIAIGANGKIIATPVAKKVFKCFTDVAGLFKCTWTDNAAEAAILSVRVPSGYQVQSAALPTS